MHQRILKLNRPLVAFDLETTGLDIHNDRIVEISCIKINPDGTREIRTKRLNPTIPIGAQATKIHGIYDHDVAHEMTFAEFAAPLADFMFGCDLTGFNIEHFDLPMLKKEFERVGTTFPAADVCVVDSFKIFQMREPRDLSAAYRFYCNQTLENAHCAEQDAKAAADILLAQVSHYNDMPCTLQELSQHTKKAEAHFVDPDGKVVWVNDEAALGFGKHRHRTLKDLAKFEPDYLRWIIKSEFTATVKDLMMQALDGKFPKRG